MILALPPLSIAYLGRYFCFVNGIDDVLSASANTASNQKIEGTSLPNLSQSKQLSNYYRKIRMEARVTQSLADINSARKFLAEIDCFTL